MNEKKYEELLYAFNKYYEKELIFIYWSNGLKIRCKSFTGMYETDTEPEDEDYIGEYAAGVNEIEILEKGTDASVEALIYHNSMEISLVNIPKKVSLEDGTILWSNEDNK